MNMPESISSIDEFAFAYCYSLTDLSLPEKVKLGKQAFWECRNLTLHIPEKDSI